MLSEYAMSSRLTVRDFSLDDVGAYKCVCKNEVSSGDGPGHQRVEGVVLLSVEADDEEEEEEEDDSFYDYTEETVELEYTPTMQHHATSSPPIPSPTDSTSSLSGEDGQRSNAADRFYPTQSALRR